ncbi:STAS domain-containing protein [Magnetofaba australis]|uniref:STAS domain-containing protein n=1 Tax=Magnetofaba australis TaxID=1472297 RepID=UPI001301DD0C|nr:STAS domain-containing protein [Magnetofaba australis]
MDLSRTVCVDQAGLGMLMGLRESCAVGARITLNNPGKQVKKMFEVTGFEQEFEIVYHTGQVSAWKGAA